MYASAHHTFIASQGSGISGFKSDQGIGWLLTRPGPKCTAEFSMVDTFSALMATRLSVFQPSAAHTNANLYSQAWWLVNLGWACSEAWSLSCQHEITPNPFLPPSRYETSDERAKIWPAKVRKRFCKDLTVWDVLLILYSLWPFSCNCGYNRFIGECSEERRLTKGSVFGSTMIPALMSGQGHMLDQEENLPVKRSYGTWHETKNFPC